MTGLNDTYPSNSALYADPTLIETVDYARRFNRRGLFDDGLPWHSPLPRSSVVAPHGGDIEAGTSELCLAIAGYHPATLAVLPGPGVVHDYWMFEGLRREGNGVLHVTSTNCDDGVARSLCGGALNAVALHGFTASQAGLPADAQVVLVGGADLQLRAALLSELTGAGLQAMDAAGHPSLEGVEPKNICNRTLLAGGGQLELTRPLRGAMFGTDTRAGRGPTTTDVFWAFVAACRDAIARVEAGQPIS